MVADNDPVKRTQGIRPAQPLTRDRVVSTATGIVDAEGVSALTIRRLAEEVGVSKNAITWHVGDRPQLLALIGAGWLGTIVLPAAERDPSRWLREFAHAYRAAAHRHPNLARLAVDGLAAVTATGDVLMPEAVVCQLAGSGMPDGELAHAYNTVLAAVVGFVALELASGRAAAVPADLARLDSASAPTVVERRRALEDRCFGLSPTTTRFDDSFPRLIDAVVAVVRGQPRRQSARGRS